jgi:hypothetical protein
MIMSKRSILLLGLTGVVVGVIASELGRALLRARVEQSLRDPREMRPQRATALPRHADDETEDPWVTPLSEENSRVTH